MSKYILLLLFFTVLNEAFSQELISGSANKYQYTITNNFKYHLNIQVTKKNGKLIEQTLLSPAQSWSKSGYFSRRKLENTVVNYFYNDEAYKKDRSRILDDFYFMEKRLRSNKEVYQDENNKVLMLKGAAEFGANWKTKYDDGFFLKLLKGTTRMGSRGYRAYRNFVETSVDLQNINNVWELLEYINTKYFKYKKEIQKVSNLLESLLGTNAKANEHVINAVIYYFEQLIKIDAYYDQNLLEAEKDKRAKLNEISNLRSNLSFSNKRSAKLIDVLSPIKLITRTPNFLISFDPLSYGNSINQYWDSPSDRIFVDENNDDEFEWSDGLWNSTFGGSFHVSITREINFSGKIYSRIYGGVSYYNTSYKLNEETFVSSNFFSQTPSNGQVLEISNPFGLEHRRLAGELIWRFYMGNVIFLDLTGGYARHSGFLNLGQSDLSEGYQWNKTRIEIIDKNYQPYFGGRIGLGKSKFNGGTHFSVGVHFFKVDHTNETNFIISDTMTNLPISYNSQDEYIYRINVGFNTAF